MPTSGEVKIHATSSYNLRSKPFPRTRQALADKENVGRPGTGNSHSPTRKSKIPVKNTKAPPPPKTSEGKKTGSQTRVRTVPNFEKLHKNWNKKFNQGKAVTKKPCTQAHAFDLTRPGTRFKRAYYSGDDHTDTEEEFHADQNALQSILENRGLDNGAITGRTTIATMGGSRQTSRVPDHRQTLGALPRQFSGRINNALNAPSAAKITKQSRFTEKSKQRKKSLVDEQDFVDDLGFEEDEDALATILNDTGIQLARGNHIPMTRQTIAATNAKTVKKTSIYYQRPKEDNTLQVYTNFARLTIGEAFSPATTRLPDFAASQTLPRNFAAPSWPNQPNSLQRAATINNATAAAQRTPGRSERRLKTTSTLGKARRTPRYLEAQERSCSPALRVLNQPRPALRTPNTNNMGGRTACWAEILDSPSGKAVSSTAKDELATALFADEDAQCPASYNMAQKQQRQQLQRIEADTSAKRHKVEEMEAIEFQLQQEIERLQQESVASSVEPSVPPSQQQTVSVAPPSHLPSQPHYVKQNVNSGMTPAASHQQFNEPTASAQSHQLQSNNSIQRIGVVTSGPQQRFASSSSNSIVNNSLQGQLGPQNSSQPSAEHLSANRSAETLVAERPVFQSNSNGSTNTSSHLPTTMLSHSGGTVFSSPFRQTQMVHHKSLHNVAGDKVVCEPSSVPADSFIHRSLQSVLQPLERSVTTTSQNTLQANKIPPSSLLTVYNLPSNHATKNSNGTDNTPSPMPLSVAGVGESSFQPAFVTTPIQDRKLSVIQTPHAVKPENRFKHQVMKRYIPAAQSTQHVLMDIPVPIQTPMAMRNVTQHGQMSEIKGHRLVSPVAQMPIFEPLKSANTEMRQPSSDLDQLVNPATAIPAPKLRLNFESAENTPSVELLPNLCWPGATLEFAATNLPTQSQVEKSNIQNIDLLTPGTRLKKQWNKSVAGHLFHETLLDEECALYTCRLQGKFAPKPIIERSCNPVAKVLMQGDNMHFVPIASGFPHTVAPAGSAFNTYTPWT